MADTSGCSTANHWERSASLPAQIHLRQKQPLPVAALIQLFEQRRQAWRDRLAQPQHFEIDADRHRFVEIDHALAVAVAAQPDCRLPYALRDDRDDVTARVDAGV